MAPDVENTLIAFMSLVSRTDSRTWKGVHDLIVLARSLCVVERARTYFGELDYDAGQKLAAELLQDSVIIPKYVYGDLREHAIKGGFEDWVAHMEKQSGIGV